MHYSQELQTHRFSFVDSVTFFVHCFTGISKDWWRHCILWQSHRIAGKFLQLSRSLLHIYWKWFLG